MNKIDPITLEVVRSALEAGAEDMATSLCKTAYNMMIYEVRDFCCGMLDAAGNLLAQNRGGVPLFLSDLGIAIADGLERYGREGFNPGDVVIMNHPYICGQHLNNIVIYTPCFLDGRLIAFSATRAHWVDVGGSRVGLGSNFTTEIFQEGLQFRSIKIFDSGKRNDGVWQMIQDNIRFPESSLGDLRGQIACCKLGEQRLLEVYKRYGEATINACILEMWDRSEAKVRAAVAAIPDGIYEAESFLDNDGRDLKTRIRVHVKVTVKGSDMIIDYSGMHPQVNGSINSGYSGGLGAARLAFKCLTLPDGPVDQGCFRPLEVILPAGTLLNARAPAALGQWSISLPTVIDTIFKALAPAIPAQIPAAHKGDLGGYSFYGVRPDGNRFMLLNIIGGGWGGRPHEDGADAAVSIVQGDVRNAPVELQEAMNPFEIECHSMRCDSGGAGKFRGGLGIEIRLKALQKCSTTISFERTQDPPWGLKGGLPGAVNQGIITRADGSERIVFKETAVAIEPGDTVTFLTAGGGGYGDPHERDPAAVLADLAEGLISRATAENVYGVTVPS
jgi:N-methylhydantoinase B